MCNKKQKHFQCGKFYKNVSLKNDDQLFKIDDQFKIVEKSEGFQTIKIEKSKRKTYKESFTFILKWLIYKNILTKCCKIQKAVKKKQKNKEK